MKIFIYSFLSVLAIFILIASIILLAIRIYKKRTLPLAKDIKSPLYLLSVKDFNKNTLLKWDEVLRSKYIDNTRVPKNIANPKPCPFCQREGDDEGTQHLFWVSVRNPLFKSSIPVSRGYLAICSKHRLQVDFIQKRRLREIVSREVLLSLLPRLIPGNEKEIRK